MCPYLTGTDLGGLSVYKPPRRPQNKVVRFLFCLQIYYFHTKFLASEIFFIRFLNQNDCNVSTHLFPFYLYITTLLVKKYLCHKLLMFVPKID